MVKYTSHTFSRASRGFAHATPLGVCSAPPNLQLGCCPYSKIRCPPGLEAGFALELYLIFMSVSQLSRLQLTLYNLLLKLMFYPLCSYNKCSKVIRHLLYSSTSVIRTHSKYIVFDWDITLLKYLVKIFTVCLIINFEFSRKMGAKTSEPCYHHRRYQLIFIRFSSKLHYRYFWYPRFQK